MARFIKDRSKASGQVPGSLVFIGYQKMDKPSIHLMEYNSETLIEQTIDNIDELPKRILPDKVVWVNIYGIHDLDLINKLGDIFKIHALLLEDILNTDQRPKYDGNTDFDLFILKMLQYNSEAEQIKAEQISIILGKGFVLTLQEQHGDVFNAVRERLRNSAGRIRAAGSDYLAYSLMDTIVDNYTFLIEQIGSKIEDLEDTIFLKKETGVVESIYLYKTELNFLRKTVRPVKDLMLQFFKAETSFFHPDTDRFMKDLYDLVTQSTDSIELYNNIVSDQLNVYSTSVSNRMNEVMKVLTTFAAFFIPLTFLAGIYGMNFEYIPELSWRYGYLAFWLLVIVIGGGLFAYFKQKKWL